jgi:hypothetical protein
VTDTTQPIGAVPINTANEIQKRHTQLVKRYLKLRKQVDRLLAKRAGRRRHNALNADLAARWPDPTLRRKNRVLYKRIGRIRTTLRARGAGLTPGVRAILASIAACESHGNPRAIGGGGAFRGKYQFTYGTWAGVGGRGDPAAASESEQDIRAAILLQRTGGSAWPVCG